MGRARSFIALLGALAAMAVTVLPAGGSAAPAATSASTSTATSAAGRVVADRELRPEFVRWDPDARWPDGEVTWGFQSFTADLTESQQRNALRSAFATWAAAADLTFTEVDDCGLPWNDPGCVDPDIRISFHPANGHEAVDGVTMQFLAHTFYPTSGGTSTADGDIHFNDSGAPWTVGSGPDLEALALHEIGHALGLRHPTDDSPFSDDLPDPTACPPAATPTRPIMCSVIYGVQRTLGPDDVAGIRALYGRSEHGVDATLRRPSDRTAVGTRVINTSARGQSVTTDRRRGETAVFFVRVTNDGTAADTVEVQAPTAPSGFTYRYFAGASGQTPAPGITRGGYEVALGAGQSTVVRVEVLVKGNAVRNRSQGLAIRSASLAVPSRVDVVRPVVKVT